MLQTTYDTRWTAYVTTWDMAEHRANVKVAHIIRNHSRDMKCKVKLSEGNVITANATF